MTLHHARPAEWLGHVGSLGNIRVREPGFRGFDGRDGPRACWRRGLSHGPCQGPIALAIRPASEPEGPGTLLGRRGAAAVNFKPHGLGPKLAGAAASEAFESGPGHWQGADWARLTVTGTRQGGRSAQARPQIPGNLKSAGPGSACCHSQPCHPQVCLIHCVFGVHLASGLGVTRPDRDSDAT